MPARVAPRAPAAAKAKPRRASYDLAFKEHVVRTALQRPPNNRIKPTCALFPGIEPCQVRPRARAARGKNMFPGGWRGQAPRAAARSPRDARPSPRRPTTCRSRSPSERDAVCQARPHPLPGRASGRAAATKGGRRRTCERAHDGLAPRRPRRRRRRRPLGARHVSLCRGGTEGRVGLGASHGRTSGRESAARGGRRGVRERLHLQSAPSLSLPLVPFVRLD